MSSFSDLLEDDLLDYAFGGTAVGFTPGTTYLALFTTTPSDAGGGVEVTGSGYARQSITWGASSGGSKTTTADVAFTASGGNFGEVSAVGIFDAASNGNMLAWDGITPATVNDGDTITFSAGGITLTLT